MKASRIADPEKDVQAMHLGPVTVLFGEKNGKYPDGNQVVVRGRDTLAIFDTPLSATRFSEHLTEADLVLLSHVHEDHTAGLHLLPQAEVWVHEADVDALRSMAGLMAHYGYAPDAINAMESMVVDKFYFQPRPDARAYPDGHVWDLGGCQVRAMHLPGHTRGHCALVVEPQGVAFIADIDLTGFGPYYGDACSSLTDFRESLARVARMEASVWVTSHHKGVITDQQQFLSLLENFRDRIDQRAEAILTALKGEGKTLVELEEQQFLYPKGFKNEYSADAERRTIELHLEELVVQGLAVLQNNRYIAA